MSATKGPSYLYGNINGEPTEYINYPYAKSFNQSTLAKHFADHGDGVGANSMREYESLAIDFSNDVDNVFHDSFVDDRGSTHKFNFLTGEFAVIQSSGIIVTYFIPDNPEVYWENDKRRHEIY